MPETLMQWMSKSAGIETPEGYQGISHQQYMPQYKRRELAPDEQSLLGNESQKWMPRIFTSDADSPAVDAASPGRSALLAGLSVGGIGALAGGLAGSTPGTHTLPPLPYSIVPGQPQEPRELSQFVPGTPFNMGTAAAVGIPAGLIAALVAYKQRQARNKDVEESMRRLPQGATRRDVEADPVVQARHNRATQMSQAAMIAGALQRR